MRNKVISLFLAVLMIVSVFSVAVAVSAEATQQTDNTAQNILLGNETAELYSISLGDDTPFVHAPYQAYVLDYSLLNYDNFTPVSKLNYSFAARTYNGTAWVIGDNSQNLDLLTTEGNTTAVKIIHGSSAPAPLKYRSAIMYDLGADYNLSNLTLKVDNSGTQLHNFSVYAGDMADESIFSNLVGRGGSADKTVTEMSVDLENATNSRYVFIVFDYASNTPGVNQYEYSPTLTAVEVYGEKVKNILNSDKVSGNLYNIKLDTSFTHGEKWAKKDYNNLTPAKISGDYVFMFKDSDDYDGDGNTTEKVTNHMLGQDNNSILKIIADESNTKSYKIEHTSGSPGSLDYRMAIGYDLGSNYNLNKLVLTQSFSDTRAVVHFSVYAGNTMDAAIFENLVAEGGSSTQETVSVDITSGTAARYVLIVFDHVTVSPYDNINMYAYNPDITNIALYGEGVRNVLSGNKTGTLYNISLGEDTPFSHAPYPGYTYALDYSILNYDNLLPAKTVNPYYPFSTYTFDGNNWVIGDESENLSLLTTDGNTTSVQLRHASGDPAPIQNRVAILYTLDGYYNLSDLKLTVDNSNWKVHNFSVYAGNNADVSLFSNLVARGGSSDSTATELPLKLSGANGVKHILITFDYVSNTPGVNVYGYSPVLKSIECLGIKTDKPKAIFGDISGDSKVNILDFIAIIKGIEAGNLGIAIADLNYDGLVDSNDLVVLRKVLLGVEVVNTLKYSDYYTLRNGLVNTYDKIKNGEDITVAFMGGSITYGIGTDGLSNSFRNLTENWLEQQYGIGVEQYNVAIPSACSAVGAFGVYDDVLVHNPDLVFVEYAINDKYAKALYTPDEISANIETVIRKIRINNPNADIVLLYTTDSNVSYTEPFFTESALHEAVAEHYGVMSVNIGHALRRTKGLESYSTPTWKDYFMDGCHTSNGGNKVYAEVIKEAILSAFRADEDTLTSVSLPAQKSSNLQMNSTYIKTANVTLEGSTGWKKASGQWDVFAQYPDGYIYTDTATNELVYTFSGTSFNLLGFINRTLTYSLDGGEWQSFSKFNSHPQPLVKGLENCEHTIRIKIDNVNNEKICVSAFLIGQPQTDADAYNTEYVELREGLNNTYYKLSTDKELKVAYIGGSITAGAGASNPATTSYRALTTAWLKEEFPDATITEINRGIGSTGSLLPTFYVDDFVANEAPDLVFLEMAVNDYLEHRTSDAVSVQYETIIRKLLAANPKCEFVSLYTINDVLPIDVEYYTQAKAQYDVAVHYGIPSANIGRKLRIDKELVTPKVDGAYTSDWKTYFGDEVHPSDAGHREYADTIEYLLSSAFAIAENTDSGIADKVLPEQKNSNLLMNTSLVLAKDLDLTGSTGWQVAASTKGAGLGVDESLIASSPENELTFKFTGTNLYFYCTAVPFDGTAPLYTVSVDGGEWQQIGPGGANPLTVLEGLGAGEHTVRFIAGGVGENAKSDTYKTFTLAAILYY